MREGKIIEHGSRDAIFIDPQHGYTKTFIDDSLMKMAFPKAQDPWQNNKNWNDALLFGRK